MIRPHAYILAGGCSSRFGSDKARAELYGKPLILHARDALAPFAASITVVSDTPGQYADLGLRTIADHEPHLGPLGGTVAALMDHAQDDALVLVSACDLVLLDDRALVTLLGAARASDRAVALRVDGRWAPFPALYHVRLLGEVRRRVAGDDRSLRAVLDRHARAIDVAAADMASVDCNTRSCLRKLDGESPL